MLGCCQHLFLPHGDHHQIRGGRRRGRRGRRVSRSSTTAPPFGRASRSRRVRLQLSSRVWSSFDSEAYHHSRESLSLLFLLSLSLFQRALSFPGSESPIETRFVFFNGLRKARRKRERERERARAQRTKKREGRRGRERKVSLAESLSQSNERECFVSSRYVVVVCALLYLCGMSGNGFFVTLFEEEEASSFITTERKKALRKRSTSRRRRR